MGLIFRRSIKTKHGRMNVSKSGISYSRTRGPVTLNSRGRITVRIAAGLTLRKKLW